MSFNIPTMPPSELLDENGQLHHVWHGMFSQLLDQLNTNLTEDGIGIPEKPTARINALAGKVKNGFLVTDSDTNELKIHLNGAFKTITTS